MVDTAPRLGILNLRMAQREMNFKMISKRAWPPFGQNNCCFVEFILLFVNHDEGKWEKQGGGHPVLLWRGAAIYYRCVYVCM
mmetsp:Transcript_38182/g.85554  ORF Transcript_38182/g.85554 Transcript_38182/m.85554 type:complete len:82 (-) Transcript_38182:70-315(-)